MNFSLQEITDSPRNIAAGELKLNVCLREGNILTVALELTDDQQDLATNLPEVDGFEKQIHNIDGKNFCSMSVKKPDRRSIFEEIITIACKSAAQASNAHDATSAFFRRLDQHIKFLRPSPRGLLNERAVIGLLGELHLIDGGTDLNINVADFIHSWTGPHREPQDFIFKEHQSHLRAIEVKTISSTDSNIIHVNGLEQLDATQFQELLLVVIRIESATKEGTTLPEKIQGISDKIKGADAEKFDELLLTCGYHSIDADKYPHRFRISSYNIYRIDDQTPALTRSRIPPGITNARYEIEISSIRNLTEPANTTWGSKK